MTPELERALKQINESSQNMDAMIYHVAIALAKAADALERIADVYERP